MNQVDQVERLARLEHDRDVQVELTEVLYDRVAYLEETVLQLEQVIGREAVDNKSKAGSPHPSLPGDAHAYRAP